MTTDLFWVASMGDKCISQEASLPSKELLSFLFNFHYYLASGWVPKKSFSVISSKRISHFKSSNNLYKVYSTVYAYLIDFMSHYSWGKKTLLTYTLEYLDLIMHSLRVLYRLNFPKVRITKEEFPYGNLQ